MNTSAAFSQSHFLWLDCYNLYRRPCFSFRRPCFPFVNWAVFLRVVQGCVQFACDRRKDEILMRKKNEIGDGPIDTDGGLRNIMLAACHKPQRVSSLNIFPPALTNPWFAYCGCSRQSGGWNFYFGPVFHARKSFTPPKASFLDALTQKWWLINTKSVTKVCP